MRLAFLPALALALTLGACGGPPAEPASGEPVTAEQDPSITQAEEALSRANRLEDRLSFPESRTHTLPPEAGQRQGDLLRLWAEGGRPVMLHVEDGDLAGRMRGQSMYYFENGELFFVRRPTERIVLDGGRIIAWLDERLEPTPDTSAQARHAREAQIQANLERFLTPFGMATAARE
jgi:hypothetical protein